MKRKVVSLLLLGTMAATTVLSGCGGSKGSDKGGKKGDDEKMSLSYTGYWCNADYEDDSYVEKKIEDALNLDITVEKAETSDTIDLLLASGEMPDCAWLDKTQDWMYEQELVRTIPKKMVEEYCPRLIELYDKYPLMYEQTLNPENKDEFLSLTGVTYQFTDYYLPGDYYRYDWIENLGIDLGVEVEEVADRLYVAKDGIEFSKFVEIMKAFIEQDPDGNGKNDTIGATAPNFGQGQFFSAFGFHAGINDVNGEAEQSYVMDEYKEYLKGFAKLYKDGLVDPEIITGDRTISWDKVNQGMSGYWITSTNSLNTWAVDRPPLTLMEKDPNAKILATPGIRPDGGKVQGLTDVSPAYGNFYVNANIDDEKLARILEFVDYTLFGAGDKDTHAEMIFGEKGVDWEWNEDETMPVKINELQSGQRGTWTFGQFGQNEEVTQWTGEEPLFAAGGKYWSKNQDGIWMDYYTTEYKVDLTGTTEYGAIRQEISGDLNAYVSNYRTQAIMGEIDVDKTWDEYLKELDRIGYNKMMDELDDVKPLAEIAAEYEK